MIGVILAAGMAKRLRPLTDDKPKCLLEIGHGCLLKRTVDALVQNGINEIVIVTGYRGNMIKDFIEKNYSSDVTFHFISNDVYDTTNNIYSLWLAKKVVDGKDFILLDSDILFDPKLISIMLKKNNSALSVSRHELGDEEMKVVVNANNDIIEISKTCIPSEALGESVGIEKIDSEYSNALFKELDEMMLNEKLVDIFYERAFERLIPKGYMFSVVDTTDIFSIELDTVEDFNQAKKLIPAELF